MRNGLGRWWIGLGLGVALAGCDDGPAVGGQSGVEPRVPRFHCMCDLGEKTTVRAEVTSLAAGTLTAIVRALVSRPVDGLAVGDEIGGEILADRGCGEAIDPAIGDEVLLFYTRGDHDGLSCVEYQACSADECGELPTSLCASPPPGPSPPPSAEEPPAPAAPEDPSVGPCSAEESADYSALFAAWDMCDTACLADTRAACDAHEQQAWLNGTVSIAARESDQWFFGIDEEDDARLTLGDDELGVLFDATECNVRFPWENRSDDLVDSSPASGEGGGAGSDGMNPSGTPDSPPCCKP